MLHCVYWEMFGTRLYLVGTIPDLMRWLKRHREIREYYFLGTKFVR